MIAYTTLYALTFLDVCLGVGETGGLAGLSAPESPQVGASLVFASLFDGVALSATLDEDLFALVNVSTSHFSCWPIEIESVKT